MVWCGPRADLTPLKRALRGANRAQGFPPIFTVTISTTLPLNGALSDVPIALFMSLVRGESDSWQT
jgi:hypothetical protein